jgi:hypothetical protein
LKVVHQFITLRPCTHRTYFLWIGFKYSGPRGPIFAAGCGNL